MYEADEEESDDVSVIVAVDDASEEVDVYEAVSVVECFDIV